MVNNNKFSLNTSLRDVCLFRLDLEGNQKLPLSAHHQQVAKSPYDPWREHFPLFLTDLPETNYNIIKYK